MYNGNVRALEHLLGAMPFLLLFRNCVKIIVIYAENIRNSTKHHVHKLTCMLSDYGPKHR